MSYPPPPQHQQPPPQYSETGAYPAAAYPSAPPYPGSQHQGQHQGQHGNYNQGYQQQPPVMQMNTQEPPLASGASRPAGNRTRPWDDEQGEDGETFGDSWSDKAIRRAFIRKVYLILMSQLLVTLGFVLFFVLHKPTAEWVRANRWVYYASFIVFIVLYLVLIYCRQVRRKVPVNYICLFVFTLAMSYMTGTISCYYDTNIVLIALGITSAVCLCVSVFAIQTKIDFTMCSSCICALCMVVFFFGIACMAVYFITGTTSLILNCVYGALAALLFSLFLMYDTQMVVGGRKYDTSPEEYVYGALQLYIDIVYLFWIILGFSGMCGGSS